MGILEMKLTLYVPAVWKNCLSICLQRAAGQLWRGCALVEQPLNSPFPNILDNRCLSDDKFMNRTNTIRHFAPAL